MWDFLTAPVSFPLWKRSSPEYPSQWYTLGFLIIASVFALYQPILDCDETFNYWEPLHYLLFGWGFQTWEYHPDFALRSWLYVSLHKVLLVPVTIFRGNAHKSVYFYSLRLLLAWSTSLAAARFRTAVGYRFGGSIGTTAGLVLLGSVGVYSAGVSFLPSSFSMILLFLSLSEWLRLGVDRRDPSESTRMWFRIIACTAFSFILGWPFALPSALVCAMHCVLHDGTHICFRFAIGVTLLILSVSTLVEATYYGRLAVPVYNLIRYNLLPTEHSGSHLYGTEPLSYMFKNLILSFNVVFPVALALPFSFCIQRFITQVPRKRDVWVYASTLWLLLGFWSFVPHKEERFFFQMYPYIVLAAAVSIEFGYQFCCRVFSRTTAAVLYGVLFCTYFSLSIARTLALFTLYSAPRALHDDLRHSMPHEDFPANRCIICYSKSWYKFPSSFFLPTDSDDVRVAFVKSAGLGAQLPVPFITTQSRHNDLNQSNKANSIQFTPLAQCDYFVTSDASEVDLVNWKESHKRYLVDAPEAPWYYRAFFFPYVSPRRLKFSPLCMYSKSRVPTE